jgi:hypothetical protein
MCLCERALPHHLASLSHTCACAALLCTHTEPKSRIEATKKKRKMEIAAHERDGARRFSLSFCLTGAYVLSLFTLSSLLVYVLFNFFFSRPACVGGRHKRQREKESICMDLLLDFSPSPPRLFFNFKSSENVYEREREKPSSCFM